MFLQAYLFVHIEGTNTFSLTFLLLYLVPIAVILLHTHQHQKTRTEPAHEVQGTVLGMGTPRGS